MMMGFGCNAAGRGRHAHHRQSARAADRDHHQQLRALQRPLAHADPDRHALHRQPGAAVPGRLGLGGGRGRRARCWACASRFGVVWGLSRTVLKGEVSTFSLELPPYRPPRVLQTLYTSLIDRTIFVLWRAVVFALPAGAVIWLVRQRPHRRRERGRTRRATS